MMMRSFAALAVLLAIVGSSNAAVLVRFINTVPQRTTQNGLTLSNVGRVVTEETNADRIGLQYFARSVVGNDVQAPTLVWTEAVNPTSTAAITPGVAPYAYAHAMPPLRQYHSTATGGAASTDRVAAYSADQVPATVYGNGQNTASGSDNYEQSTLKADGVGLYLVFAAGSYQIQAYAALGATVEANAISQTPKQLTNTLRTVTFEDNRVYTIVATGDGKFSATVTNQGNTVALTVFEESTAPTTFGMASLRWFHAIKTQSGNPISVFRGDTSDSLRVASNIAFGSLSDYVDVAPATAQTFPVTIQTNAQTVIAPTTAGRFEVTHDIRAGLRATIICAVNDETTSTVFCRMIPSRVVAYVRLINDLSSQSNLIQGAFGSQALKDVKLTLWGSYEFPRPEVVVEQSQKIGANSVPRSSAQSRGLYGVVSSVSSGTCSGYGEVWVPLLINDYAVRHIIVRDNLEVATTFAGNNLAAYNSGPNVDNQQNPSAFSQWFWGAPIFKRVNFVVKTESGSTLTGQDTVVGIREDSTNVWYTSSVLLDEYMEPGQYYTLIATTPATATPAAVTVTPLTYATGSSVRYFWRLDRTVEGVASGSSLATGKANVNFVPFGTQNLRGTINLRRKGATNINLTPSITATSDYAVAASVAGTGFTWNTPASPLIADAGDYTFDHTVDPTPANNPNNDVCLNKFPGSTDLTLASGDTVDIFLFNSYGCKINNNDANRLVVNVCKAQSALVTGHAVNTLLDGAPAPSSPGFFAASASTASSSVALLVAAIIAIIAALL